MSKTIYCNLLVRKDYGAGERGGKQPVKPMTTAEWIAEYERHEREQQVAKAVDNVRGIFENAARSIAATGYTGPLVVMDLLQAYSEAQMNGAKILFTYENIAIVADERGEMQRAQDARRKQAANDKLHGGNDAAARLFS
jgi:hypothetical protein